MKDSLCPTGEVEFILIGDMECLSRPWTNSAPPSSIGRVSAAMFVLDEPTCLAITDWTRDGHLPQTGPTPSPLSQDL